MTERTNLLTACQSLRLAGIKFETKQYTRYVHIVIDADKVDSDDFALIDDLGFKYAGSSRYMTLVVPTHDISYMNIAPQKMR